jgi:hypothetical protein
MNGDISVDIEPIHRTTGHKSAAFVGGYNTIGAPTRMTWSLNAGLSKFSSISGIHVWPLCCLFFFEIRILQTPL